MESGPCSPLRAAQCPRSGIVILTPFIPCTTTGVVASGLILLSQHDIFTCLQQDLYREVDCLISRWRTILACRYYVDGYCRVKSRVKYGTGPDRRELGLDIALSNRLKRGDRSKHMIAEQ